VFPMSPIGQRTGRHSSGGCQVCCRFGTVFMVLLPRYLAPDVPSNWLRAVDVPGRGLLLASGRAPATCGTTGLTEAARNTVGDQPTCAQLRRGTAGHGRFND
jgi:hypothetical protein